MLKRKKTVINGVELPSTFPVTSVINNIAISDDGRYAAVTKAGDLVIADIPENGRIEVDGTTINYQKGAGRSKMSIGVGGVRISSFGGSSVVVSGHGSYVSIGGSDLEYEIDQGYDEVSRLSLNERTNDITVGLSDLDRKVHVKGLTSREPDYNGGRLVIDGLKGTLLLPTFTRDIEQDLKTMSGNIDGNVAHKGRIKTMSGDISIRLLSPLIVEASTMSGDIDVRGMIAEGRARYRPPTGNPGGNLYLETMSGDINVRYKDVDINQREK